MAGDTPDDDSQPGGTYPGDQSGFLNPDLAKFVGNFQTPEGQQWAAEAASKVQDFLTTDAIARNAEEAGHEFVNNLHDTKANLIGLVQKNTGALDLALDLAPHAVKALVAQHDVPDGDMHAAAIASDMQGSIAHAGITRLAELDHGAATDAISKYADVLPDGAGASLRNYADTQAQLRAQDAQASRVQQNRAAATASLNSGSQWLDKLTDDNGRLQFPPGFSSQMFSDMSLDQPTKAALHAAYVTLQQRGDVRDSHPDVLNDLATRIADGTPPHQGEVFAHVGRGLSLADAGYLGGMLGPQSVDQRTTSRQLASVLSDARDSIATLGNGPAGAVAYNRFTSWLMDGIHAGTGPQAMMGDDPAATLARFAPTHEDAVPTQRGYRVDLGTIFNSDRYMNRLTPGRDRQTGDTFSTIGPDSAQGNPQRARENP